MGLMTVEDERKAPAAQLETLPNPVNPRNMRIRVHCFGNFELFVDGRPLRFTHAKTKELLAYLVSRQGALCGNNEIVAVIWQGNADSRSLQSYYRNIVSDLTRAFHDAGINDVLVKQRGFLGIAPDKVSCDFYDYCAGIDINNYMGEFMSQYRWAQPINDFLKIKTETV